MNEKYIFISYAHKDNDIALPIFEEIARYYNIWYDSSIEIGTEWPDYIGQKLYDCDTVMILLSDNYVASVNCINEVNFALKYNKEVLVVHLHDGVKMTFGLDLQLGSKQAVYLSKYSSTSEFVKYLSNAQMIKDCKRVQDTKSIATKNNSYEKVPSNHFAAPASKLDAINGTGNNYWEKKTINTILDTFDSFNLKVKYMETVAGPTVTRFEFQPERGVSLRSIQNYIPDLSLYLGVSNVRCICPIPGKTSFGIEIPNPRRSIVEIKELLSDKSFALSKNKLNIALGKDITGENVFFDITKAPHMLVAGRANSGKTVCVNGIIVSLLYRMAPSELRLLLIDPKIVDLIPYDGIPHLLAPVITDSRDAQLAIEWAVEEMERRYTLFTENKAIRLEAYNELAKKNGREVLPYIVIVINEYADLKQQISRFDDNVVRLVQKARAAGIHLVIATQRPSADVISGVLKANIPTRIAFAVSSSVDSRVILDENGAQELLDRGDMLFKNPSDAKTERIQGVSVSDYEIENIVGYVKSTYGTGTDNVIKAMQDNTEGESGEMSETEDEKLYLALGYACENGKVSISFLMKRLKVGFARAERILSRLEELGYISKQDGSKPRKVLISMDDFRKIIIQRERQKK